MNEMIAYSEGRCNRTYPSLLSSICAIILIILAIGDKTVLKGQGLEPENPSKEYIRLGTRPIAIEVLAQIPPGTPPETGDITIIPGSPQVNTAATIEATFTAGAAEMDQALIIFNEDVWAWRGCYIGYNPSVGQFFLHTEESESPWWETIPRSHGFCSVTSGSADPPGPIGPGQSVTITVQVVFTSALAGTAKVFSGVSDKAQVSSGWDDKGTVTINPNSGPSVSSVVPSSGSGQGTVFTLNLYDLDGYRNIAWSYLNIVASDYSNCAILHYTFAKRFYMTNDAGDMWIPLPNGQPSISNSRCTLFASGTSADGSGYILPFAMNILFNLQSWPGLKGLYGHVQDRGEVNMYTPSPIGTYTVQ